MIGIMIVTLIGLFSGIIISIVSSKLINKEDKILELLPLYNCNKCGFGSCSGMSKAAINDINCLNKCKFLSQDMKIKIEELL